MIGIIGAMEEEVKALADMMSGVETATVAGMVFKKGQFKGKDVVVVRSGIGKVNAAVCTQILADRYNVDCVINTGVAGSLKNEINIGDIVISSDAIQHLHWYFNFTGCIVETFAAYCTEMEGAAIAQAAYLNSIPFLIIRAISDKADDSASMDYGEFERKAIEHSVLLMENLIRRI